MMENFFFLASTLSDLDEKNSQIPFCFVEQIYSRQTKLKNSLVLCLRQKARKQSLGDGKKTTRKMGQKKKLLFFFNLFSTMFCTSACVFLNKVDSKNEEKMVLQTIFLSTFFTIVSSLFSLINHLV